MRSAARRSAVLVVLLSLVAFDGGAMRGGNPAAAVAAAAGHPSRGRFHATATFKQDGQTVNATLDIDGRRRLERVCRDDVCSGSWFDGSREYALGLNDAPFPERDADERLDRTFAAIVSTTFGEPDFVSGGGSIRTLPSDGQDERYLVSAPGGSELIAVADRLTHRLRDVERPDRTPYRRLDASADGSTIVYATRQYDLVGPLGAPIVPPAGPSLQITGSSRVSLLSPDLPIIPCTLGGRRARCLLDTGTTPSAMTLAFAEAGGQEPHGTIDITGVGTFTTGIVVAGPLVLGSARAERVRFAVIPHAAEADFDLILGCDVLATMLITFDLAQRSAELSPSRTAPSVHAIAVDFAAGVPYVQVRLGARPRVPMLLDTGDAETLSIGYDAFRAQSELFGVTGAGVAVGVGVGARDTVRATVAQVDIGGEILSDPTVNAVRGQHVGHVGYGFAAHCRSFSVDLAQARIECGAAGRPASGAGDHETPF